MRYLKGYLILGGVTGMAAIFALSFFYDWAEWGMIVLVVVAVVVLAVVVAVAVVRQVLYPAAKGIHRLARFLGGIGDKRF